MSSRQEEKEARRRERLEREEAERRAAARNKRLQIVLGGLLAVLLLGGVVYVAVKGIGGGDGPNADGGRQPTQEDTNATLPEPQFSSLEEAVKAAGCKLTHAKYEGADHIENKDFSAADYETNPPTSGAHDPTWYEDGIYDPGNVPQLGKLVHTLEHGRINIQYKPGTPQNVIDQLEAIAAEKTGYHILLYENTTDMPFQVAATGWTQLVGCEEWNDAAVDVLRLFYDEYVDKGPEAVP